MTGAIILEVPGDKDRKKASTLVSQDVSVSKKELRDTLALAAGCDGAEVQVGEIGTTRNGLGSAWVRCPLFGARKLAQAGKIALGWSTLQGQKPSPKSPCSALDRN
ncbi:uncharacterized protein LOC117238902 [Bombus vosnesenskii]|uniref:Uncharacterized protein LOC117238902 n=1 Tax=Bombus vosnesenskii TaxID=207650 RepID=A0A6J3L2X9_9HYME|nr:uncharacterized protein LOC117238902 [Bombus vosnesenskii]